MTTPQDNLSRFSHYFWLTLGMFVVFTASFVVYVRAEKQIDRANVLRQQSFLLVEGLRHSSDNLTNMARTYVVTGVPFYKQRYQEILDIRNGKMPRPDDYQNVYRDRAPVGDQSPGSLKPAVSFLELMRQTGFTEEEFASLAEAKANSDALTRTEFEAMALIESANPPTEADPGPAKLQLKAADFAVRVPTLVLWGERDRALLTGCIEGLDALVPRLKLVRVPEASHWIVHEQPARVVSEIEAFVGAGSG